MTLALTIGPWSGLPLHWDLQNAFFCPLTLMPYWRSNPMTRGFGKPPAPWRCRISDDNGPLATLDIAAVDGRPITQRNAAQTAVLIVSLLQQPTDPGCHQRLVNRLGESAAVALVDLAADLQPVFWVDVIAPNGKRVGQGYSYAAGKLPRNRMTGPVRTVNPALL